jgi:hypothetical protein
LGMDWSHRRKSALMLSTRLNQMTWQDTRRNSALAAVHWFRSRLYMDLSNYSIDGIWAFQERVTIGRTGRGSDIPGACALSALSCRALHAPRPVASPTSGQGRGSTDGFFQTEGVCKKICTFKVYMIEALSYLRPLLEFNDDRYVRRHQIKHLHQRRRAKSLPSTVQVTDPKKRCENSYVS